MCRLTPRPTRPESLYSPLNTLRREIRVLAVLPPSTNSPEVRCVLSTISLRGSPVYNALSYVWGDARVTTTIQVNGHAFEATQNLVAALIQLRTMPRRAPIWIDAISINQKDIEEKNQQVPLMRDIYRGASMTLAWLGKVEEESRLAFQLLRKWDTIISDSKKLFSTRLANLATSPDARLQALVEQVTRGGGVTDEAVWHEALGAFQATVNEYVGTELRSSYIPREYDAFISLMRLPYWNRVWIIQEFALSRQLTLLWGTESLPYSVLSGAGKAMMTHNIYGLDTSLTAEHLTAIATSSIAVPDFLMELRKRYTELEAINYASLWELICQTQGHRATMPVDKIYSLLGLLAPSDISLEIDYSIPAATLFKDLTVKMINSPLIGLNVLGLVRRFLVKKPSLDLPSWVPEFAEPLHIFDTQKTFYDWSDSNLTANPNVRGDMLELNAIIGAKVKSVHHWIDSKDRADSSVAMADTLEIWLESAFSRGKTHPSGFPKLQVFFRTLLLDASGYGLSDTRFRSAGHESEFFNDAVAFFTLLGDFLGSRMLRKRLDRSSSTSPRSLTYDFATLSSLTDEWIAAQYLRFYNSNVPNALKSVALWMLVSPITPNEISVSEILEWFCGPAGSRNYVPFSDMDNRLRGGTSLYSFSTKYLSHSILRKDGFFMLSNGYMGLGPEAMSEGDFVCSVPGCSYPLIIRSKERVMQDGIDRFEVIGACYVYGMMNGEVAADPEVKKKMRRVVFE